MNTYILDHITKSLSDWRTIVYLKKIALLCCVLCLITLSGCSSTSDFLLRHSGIMSEEDYQRYIELRNSGQLDSDGRYAATELTGEQVFSPPAGSVHVTFAENAYITVRYYLDANLKTPVNVQQCYLKPGDYIYASKPECHHPSSIWYSFDRFCVYPYDSGKKQETELLWNAEDESPLVLQIPEDYTGAEIAVVPTGKYEKRRLEFSDYYTDSANQPQELNGIWIVNDREVSSNILSVSPVEPLFVDFQYNPEKYAFVSSNPSSFYHENGLVRFETIKYSKWEKGSQKILNKHPAEKIWYVTLSNSDSYGTCVYKLDGTVVSGRVGIREGQKLTLEYTLTSSNKKIIRSGPGGFVGGLVHSNTENCTIPVSETLDGKTIQRSDYIQVK